MIDRRSFPRRHRGGDPAAWRLLFLVMLGAFLGMGIAASVVGILPGDLDVRAGLLMPDHSSLRTVAWTVNWAGTWRVLLPASLIAYALSPVARRRWWLWAAAFLASGAVEQGVKYLVARPRPSGFSLGFPSGHTTAAAVFAVGLVYVLGRARLGTGARLALQCAAVSGMLLVGWARIVLRAHWPTDVLGGLLLGAACAAAVAWWDSSREAEATRQPAEDERPMARAGLARS